MKLPSPEDLENAEKLVKWLEPMVPLLQGIRDGTHKIVPMDPNSQMKDAGYNAIGAIVSEAQCAVIYRAMVKFAP